MKLRIKSLEECKKIDPYLHGISEEYFRELEGLCLDEKKTYNDLGGFSENEFWIPKSFTEYVLEEDKKEETLKEQSKTEMLLLDIRDLLIEIKDKLK